MSDPAPYELPDESVRAAWQRLLGKYLVVEPLEPALANRLRQAGVASFVELGSATGPISQLLAASGVACIALDATPPPDSFRPMVRADLRALPVADASCDAASAVNCLYFLADPTRAISEAQRIIRPGGVFLAGAPSRYHDPELQAVLPEWGTPSPFDAEEAAVIVAGVFDDVEAEWWEAPAYFLPDRAAVVDYLVAFKVPEAEERAAAVSVPTHVTKSGVNVWARQ